MAVRFAAIIEFHWGCNAIARECALVVEFIATFYLFALVLIDFYRTSDDSDEDNMNMDMEKLYLKAVSITYASAYMTFTLAVLLTEAIFSTSFLLRPISCFIAAAYLSMVCSYLASPKWRQELFQTGN
jgi:hypothetical protein